jgi:hypothetical protein
MSVRSLAAHKEKEFFFPVSLKSKMIKNNKKLKIIRKFLDFQLIAWH